MRISPVTPVIPVYKDTTYTCPKCKLFFKGATGYVCSNQECPVSVRNSN
jgi:hypothetical protein